AEDGTALPDPRPVTVDGWKQGWVLPASGAGMTLELAVPAETPYRAALLTGPFALLLVLLLFLVRGADRAGAAARPWRARGLVTVAATAAVAGLVAGPAGLAITVGLGAGALLARLPGRRPGPGPARRGRGDGDRRGCGAALARAVARRHRLCGRRGRASGADARRTGLCRARRGLALGAGISGSGGAGVLAGAAGGPREPAPGRHLDERVTRRRHHGGHGRGDQPHQQHL